MVKKVTPTETIELASEVKELNKHLNRLASIANRNVSFKYALGLSILRGAGYAIGATLVAGIAVALISQAIRSANEIPLIGPALQADFIQENLPNSQEE